MVFDFDGHTIGGIGSNYGIEIGVNVDNITFKNGIIDNWDQGVRYNYGNVDTTRVYFDNMKFTNSASYAIYINNFCGSSQKSVEVSNSYIEDNVYLRGILDGIFYGNNISTGNLFTFGAWVNNFDANPTINGNPVGNFWQDFTCDDENNFYSVIHNGLNYTICNENDYTNGTTDTAPLIDIQQAVYGGGSSTHNDYIFPFGGTFTAVFSLLLVFVFL